MVSIFQSFEFRVLDFDVSPLPLYPHYANMNVILQVSANTKGLKQKVLEMTMLTQERVVFINLFCYVAGICDQNKYSWSRRFIM